MISKHIVRGGSWLDSLRYSCVAYRSRRSDDDRNYNLGFRMVRVKKIVDANEKLVKESKP